MARREEDSVALKSWPVRLSALAASMWVGQLHPQMPVFLAAVVPAHLFNSTVEPNSFCPGIHGANLS